MLPEGLIEALLAADVARRHERDELTDRVKVDVHGGELGIELQHAILTDELRARARDFHDHAWRAWFDRVTRSFEAAVSRYPPDQGMSWHCDHQNQGRILNFTIALNQFEGGELLLSRDPIIGQDCYPDPLVELALPCDRNRLILFPAWYTHQAEPARTERIVCHGHVSMYPPGLN